MKHRACAGLLAGVTISVLPVSAFAQTNGNNSPDKSVEGTETDAEIVVTARKRSETVLEVPAAITVISADDRKGMMLDRTGDYLRQVPGAALVSSGPEYLQDITIRGQGSGRLGFSETATGIFRNGLYNAGGGFGGRAFSRLDVFDADRIEVLRGPQGALYGRNSVGGTIDIHTNEPSFEPEGSLNLRYAKPQRSVVEAIANLPIIDNRVAIRIGGFYDLQSSGFYRNDAGTILDKTRYTGLRAALRTEIGAGGTFDLTYEYSDSNSPAYGAQAQRATRIDGTVLDASPYVRSDMDRNGDARIRDHLVMAGYAQDFGGITLNVKALYKTRKGSRSGEDNDHFAGVSSIDVMPGAAFAGPDYSIAQYEDHDHWLVQAYVASAQKDASITWMVGAEYLVSNTDTSTVPNFCPAYTGSVLPDTPGCFVGRNGTLSTFGASARNAGRLNFNNDSFIEKLRSPSIFGSVEFAFGPDTRLEVAARVQRDSKTFDFMRYSQDPLVYFGSGAIPVGLAAPISIDPDGAGPLPASPVQFCPPTLSNTQCASGRETLTAHSTQKGTYFTPAISLRHNFSPNFSGYIRFATGYRPGGSNTNLPPTTVRSQVDQSLNYLPEHAYSGEVGFKGRIAGITFSVAGYYVRTKGIQVVTAPSPTSRGFVLQNAGNAHVYGLEVEARRRWNLGGGASFQLSTAATTQGGAFEKGASVLLDQSGTGTPVPVSLAGTPVPRLRKLQLTTNATLVVPIGSEAKFILNGGMQYASGGIDSPSAARPYSGYTLFDARAGIQFGDLTVSAFVKNLTNKVYVLNVLNANTYYSEPRTFGIELRGSF